MSVLEDVSPVVAAKIKKDIASAPTDELDVPYPNASQTATEKQVFGFADLLQIEGAWIDDRAETRRIRHHPHEEVRGLPARQIGLAISGGGVRSATYGLGVLQALAKPMKHGKSLLGQLGYISSVSGGSYINSWLTAWIRRTGFAVVEAALAEAKLPASASQATKQQNGPPLWCHLLCPRHRTRSRRQT